MHARVIEGGTTPDRRHAMDRIVTDELIPALEAEHRGARGEIVIRAHADELPVELDRWTVRRRAPAAAASRTPRPRGR